MRTTVPFPLEDTPWPDLPFFSKTRVCGNLFGLTPTDPKQPKPGITNPRQIEILLQLDRWAKESPAPPGRAAAIRALKKEYDALQRQSHAAARLREHGWKEQ